MCISPAYAFRTSGQVIMKLHMDILVLHVIYLSTFYQLQAICQHEGYMILLGVPVEVVRSTSWREDEEGALKFSFPSPYLLSLSCVNCTISIITSLIFSLAPFAYHITHIITISYSSGLATFICAFHNSYFAPSVCPSSSTFMNFLVLGHISFMELLFHQQGFVLSPWCCPTDSARFPTCVCLRATQLWRLSGPSLLPLLISLGAEPGPWVVYTHVVSRWGPRRHSRPSGRVTAVVAVPSWRVTADWELRCNQPQVPWSHEGISACIL
jgi:hypothetical protein